MGDFVRAIAAVRPTVTADDVRKQKEFEVRSASAVALTTP